MTKPIEENILKIYHTGYYCMVVDKYAKNNNLTTSQAAVHLLRLLDEENDSDYWKKRSSKDRELFWYGFAYWATVAAILFFCACFITTLFKGWV